MGKTAKPADCFFKGAEACRLFFRGAEDHKNLGLYAPPLVVVVVIIIIIVIDHH